MNIIKDLQGRIAARMQETKNPCKTYATEDGAEKAAKVCAQMVANHFAKDKSQDARPAMYVVIQMPGSDRFTYCVCISEVLGRESSTGGFLGIAGDVYTF